ncbi:hypothetical protein ACHQM5_008525 [Ranunculus cassubicifolius]
MGDTSGSDTSESWNFEEDMQTHQSLPIIRCYSSESDDELFDDEFENAESLSLPWYTNQSNCSEGAGSTSTSANTRSDLFSMFVGMGFPEKMVKKVISENGESDKELILEALLTYSSLDKLPSEPGPCDSPESKNDSYYDFSDAESCLGNKEDGGDIPDNEKKLLHLIEMGFPIDEASSAIKASGPNTSIAELMDFICATQMSKTDDAPEQPFSGENKMGPSDYHGSFPSVKKRKPSEGKESSWRSKEKISKLKKKTVIHEERKISEGEEKWKRKMKSRQMSGKLSKLKQKAVSFDDDEMTIHIPKNMIGFGVPRDPRPVFERNIPDAAVGPPFFYYENVALAPKGVWGTMCRFLFEIKPEFVDSKHFCAAMRKRGYIHNLPIHNRFPLQPIPPHTIKEAFPQAKKWWPEWDDRTQLNCLNTCHASAKLTERIREALEQCNGQPHDQTIKWLRYECRKWNLIWTGKNKAAPLEPVEMEAILGYPEDHTRGVSSVDRYKALGNSFQVDTVAYHLSVLKRMFPNGMNVLSLFSGIGGAEVALHRLGIPLNNVVSVEISQVNRTIIRSWWEQTSQKGNLIELEDVQDLSPDKVEELTRKLGGFDLIVGGSPCNNLTGNNRHHRDGLKGEHSVLFYDYFRILNTVKLVMANN